MAWVTVEVSAKLLNPPPACACCGTSTGSYQNVSIAKTRGQRIVRVTSSQQWAFPCCDRCLLHGNTWKPASTIVVEVLVAWVLAAVVIWASPLLGVVLGGGASIAIIALGHRRRERAKALRTQNCSHYLLPVAYLNYYGSIHRFAFSSQSYAVAFARANAKKLVNVDPSLHRLLATGPSRTGGVP